MARPLWSLCRQLMRKTVLSRDTGAAGSSQGKSALTHAKGKVCKFSPLFPESHELCKELGRVGERGASVWLVPIL